MKLECKLLFGKNNYVGEYPISPKLMLELLRHPFSYWLYQDNWPKELKQDEDEFHTKVFELRSSISDEDFDFHPRDYEWQGIRFDIAGNDNHTELVFSLNIIDAETHLDYHKICGEMFEGVQQARKILNQFQTPFKEENYD